MTTNEQDLRALAYLAKRLRSEGHGAAKWDDAGLWSVLKKLEGHNLAMTIERVTRHAADIKARTPAAIERPFVPDTPKAEVRYPPKATDECTTHPGEWLDACRICAGPAAADGDEKPRPNERRPPSEAYVQARQAIKEGHP